MTDIVLVDDAAEILHGLAKTIHRLPLDCTVSRTFLNAPDAIESCLADPPDILITDIRLPGMSGIELAAALNQFLHRTIILALSAYDEFEYVQNAMATGVFRYLLKPVSADSLQEALTAAMEELKKIDANERIRLDRDNFRVYNCIYELINNIPLRCAVSDCPELCDENGKPSPYRLAIVERSVSNETSFFHDSPDIYSVQTNKSDLALLIGDNFNITQFCQDFQLKLRNSGKRGAVSPRFSSLSELYKDSRKTEMILETELLLSDTVLLSLREEWFGNGQRFLENEWGHFLKVLEEAKKSFLEVDRSALLAHLAKAEMVLQTMQCCPPANEIRRAYIAATSSIAAKRMELYGPDQEENELFSSLKKGISEAGAIKEISRAFEELFIRLFNSRSIHETSVAQIINRTKAYIELNYDKHITTAVIARTVHMSPNYLGTLFRQKMGINLWTYVTKVRIEKAYAYLRDTNLSVGQIANLVGFSNINTFYCAFKKIYGVAPGQFRQGNTADKP